MRPPGFGDRGYPGRKLQCFVLVGFVGPLRGREERMEWVAISVPGVTRRSTARSNAR